MPENQSKKKDGTAAEDQKERGYYYDDAHGYEKYEPEEEEEEEDEEEEEEQCEEPAVEPIEEAGASRIGAKLRRVRDRGITWAVTQRCFGRVAVSCI